MEKTIVTKLKKSFEGYAQEADGIACKKSGQGIQNHFPEVRKMVKLGSGALRENYTETLKHMDLFT